MEYKLIELIFQGGYLAVSAFLIYIIFDIKKKNDELRRDISQLNKEKLSIEEFYRMFSGWREEIRDLNNKIEELKNTIIKELIK